jgi:hypothetical protein
MRTIDREQDAQRASQLLRELGIVMTECKRCASSDSSDVMPLFAVGRLAAAELPCTETRKLCRLIREFEREARAERQDTTLFLRKKSVSRPPAHTPASCCYPLTAPPRGCTALTNSCGLGRTW